MLHRRILAAALLALPTLEAARAEPYAELGLDLTTPDAAARAFRDAWAARRYLRIWFILEPALRRRFMARLNAMAFNDILETSGGTMPAVEALTERVAELLAEHSRDGQPSWIVDDAALIFWAIMRAAADRGWLPFDLAPDAALPLPSATPPAAEMRRRLGGPSPFLDLNLRRSPGGHWRVAGVARPGGAPVPRIWNED